MTQLSKLETLIAKDQKLPFLLISYVLTLIIYVNLNTLQSPVLGLAASFFYFLINGIFLGRVFFEKEDTFSRLTLGSLLLVLLLGFVGWLALIVYNLNVANSSLVLFVVCTICSLLNHEVKFKNGTQR